MIKSTLYSYKYAQSPSKFKTEYIFQTTPYGHHKSNIQWEKVIFNDNVMTWKRFPDYWPFVRLMNGSPSQRANDMELWCFFVVSPNKLFNKQSSYHRSNLCITPWGDCSGHWWIPTTESAEFWCCLYCLPQQTVEQAVKFPENWNQSWQALAPFNSGFLSKKATNAEAWLFFVSLNELLNK